MNENVRMIFAQRLRQARTRAMLSMDELCRRMDGAVSRQAIFKYENGEMLPDSTRLIKFAHVLGQSVDFFFRPITFDINVEDISFRKACLKGKKLDALKVTIQDAVERYLEINDILGLSNDKLRPVEPPKEELLTAQDMVECARIVRKEWQIGATPPIFHTPLLLMQHGIDVIECCGDPKFDAVSLIANGKPVIVMNKNIDMVERRRLTAMHELGHLLFNKYMDKVEDTVKEKMCTVFANEMLLPTNVVVGLFKKPRNVSLEELFCVQQVYGISAEAIMHKLKDMGIITEKRYRTFCIIRHKPDVKEQLQLSRYKEKPLGIFEAKVYRALAQSLITERKGATLLNVPVTEVREKVNTI